MFFGKKSGALLRYQQFLNEIVNNRESEPYHIVKLRCQVAPQSIGWLGLALRESSRECMVEDTNSHT